MVFFSGTLEIVKNFILKLKYFIVLQTDFWVNFYNLNMQNLISSFSDKNKVIFNYMLLPWYDSCELSVPIYSIEDIFNSF